jgi:hypothetical protein
MAAKPVYAIRVSSGLYLDNENKFHSAPPAGSPVYELGGGLLTLSNQTRGGLLSGHLAVLPLKDEPSWKGKLRKLNVSEDSIELFGKAASLIGDVVTVIGWAQAAFKIAQWLGIFEQGKSVEQLAAEILAGVETLQSMQVEGQEHNVKGMLDSSRELIAASYRQAKDSSLGGPFLLKNMGGVALDLAERKRRRIEIHKKAEVIDGQLGQILAGSRWQLFLHPDHYLASWGARIPNAPARTVKNPPWWRSFPSLPELKYLADDGNWPDATYPPAFKLRFDYRAALPHALYGAMAYVTTLKLAEPEFRSTAVGRGSLLAHADRIASIMSEMRAVLTRTDLHEYNFRLPGTPASRPYFQWRVGALDLCAHTDSYFDQQVASVGQAQYRLGVLDFDWMPPDPGMTWISTVGGRGYWTFVDSYGAVQAANRQAEQDHAVLLQMSGYFQLAQMEASLRHLATDPDTSETVDGTVRRTRRRTGSRSVEVVGYYGIMCAPEKVTATGTIEEHRCHATVGLSLQPKDRVTGLLPVRVLLVSLDAPPDATHFNVRSEHEIWPRTVDTVALDAVSTFDWYIATATLDQLVRPLDKHLDLLASRRTMSYPSQTFSLGGRNLSERPDRVWFDVDLFDPSDDLPTGERRNQKTESVTFEVKVEDRSTEVDRTLDIRITSTPGTRNVGLVYVGVEETLASGRKLRTYFDVHMNTELTYLPKSFFEAERKCLDDTTRIVDHIDRNYTESAFLLRPDVPVTLDQFHQHVRRLEAEAPDIVRQAILAIGQR